MPGTLKRSPEKAQRTYAEALDSALEQYGDERRAHQVAFAAVKRGYEKVGDRWEPKKRKGPSDPRARAGRRSNAPTAGGVDVEGHTKDELVARARKLGITGRSTMTKLELGQAIARKQD